MKLQLTRNLIFILGAGILATLLQTAEVWGQQAAVPAQAFAPTVMTHYY